MTVLDKCGLFRCAPACGPHILQVTLLSAANIAIPSGFYFEVSAEPASGQPKISRVHKSAGSNPVDLNEELLELDWIGDEEEVTIHLMSISGNKQSQDICEGELVIPCAAVKRYAQEARGHDREVQYGSRRFQMLLPEEAVAVQRKRRFQDMLLPHGELAERLSKKLVAKLSQENGIEMPTEEEMETLRRENQELKEQHAALSTQASQRGYQTGYTAFSAIPTQDVAGILVVRFQLLPKRHMAHETDQAFRRATPPPSDSDG